MERLSLSKYADAANAFPFKSGKKRNYSDLILAFGIVSIISLMILPLPLWVVDTLVAMNILIGVGLVLLAIYIPAVTAFSSFPSVIMLSTLFRLALSISITRLILLNADGGEIIEAFGRIVVGGNVVVGIVVFIIITVVQFIVIAKGAERVAEVAARFSLDAMPGKQLSIDSDLRSGLLDKEEAKEKRKLLELESQLHGSLDGAMKFVKGDSIAGIVILIVNILGGLTVGVLQMGMDIGTALETYSVLTVGDGLVSQIPALLTSIAAGLIITRTASESKDNHLGHAISSQIGNYPKVVLIGGILSLLLMLVPGFPWPIFLAMSILLLGSSAWTQNFMQVNSLFPNAGVNKPDDEEKEPDSKKDDFERPALAVYVSNDLRALVGTRAIRESVDRVAFALKEEYGAPIPPARVKVAPALNDLGFYLEASGIKVVIGQLVKDEDNQNILHQLELTVGGALSGKLGLFMGIQECANLVNSANESFPDLIKETLRYVAPQRVAEIMRRLLNERIPIKHIRELFEAIIVSAGGDSDLDVMVERVRIALKHQISDRYAGMDRKLKVLLVHPDVEEVIHELLRNNGGGQLALDPDFYQQLVARITQFKAEIGDAWDGILVMCSADVRRYVRSILEQEFFSLPVISYSELAGDIQVESLGHIKV